MIEVIENYNGVAVTTYEVSEYSYQNNDVISAKTLNHGDVVIAKDARPDLFNQLVNSNLEAVPFVPYVNVKAEALTALKGSDMVALRCIKTGVLFPAEWQQYVDALREVLNGTLTVLPVQPNYPQGT